MKKKNIVNKWITNAILKYEHALFWMDFFLLFSAVSCWGFIIGTQYLVVATFLNRFHDGEKINPIHKLIVMILFVISGIELNPDLIQTMINIMLSDSQLECDILALGYNFLYL